MQPVWLWIARPHIQPNIMSTMRTLLLFVIFSLASSVHAQQDIQQSSSKELMIVQFGRVDRRIWVFDANGETTELRPGKDVENHTRELLTLLQKLYDEGWSLVVSSTEGSYSTQMVTTIYLLERERRK